jgi:hypothetical protein
MAVSHRHAKSDETTTLGKPRTIGNVDTIKTPADLCICTILLLLEWVYHACFS